MTDFLKIAKSIAFHFAHICAYGVETVKLTRNMTVDHCFFLSSLSFSVCNLIKADLINC